MAGASKVSKDDLFRQVVALKSFNSHAGGPLEKEAGKALRKLPKSIDPDLLRATFERFAAESPTYLWQAFKWLRAEHVQPLLAALAKDDSIEAKFVRALVEGEDPAASFQRFSQIAPLIDVAHVIITGGIGAKRVDDETAGMLAGLAGDARVVGAAAAVVEGAPPESASSVYQGGMFSHLVVLLGLAGDERAAAALAKLADAFIRNPEERLTRFQRNLERATAPAVTAIRDRLEREHLRRFEASEAGRWVTEVGLTVPAGHYWWLKIEIPAARGGPGADSSYARLEIEALGPAPRWEIQVYASRQGLTRMSERDSSENASGLTPVTTPRAFREVLDEAAAKLGLTWNTEAAKVTTREVDADLVAIQKWLARTTSAP